MPIEVLYVAPVAAAAFSGLVLLPLSLTPWFQGLEYTVAGRVLLFACGFTWFGSGAALLLTAVQGRIDGGTVPTGALDFGLLFGVFGGFVLVRDQG